MVRGHHDLGRPDREARGGVAEQRVGDRDVALGRDGEPGRVVDEQGLGDGLAQHRAGAVSEVVVARRVGEQRLRQRDVEVVGVARGDDLVAHRGPRGDRALAGQRHHLLADRGADRGVPLADLGELVGVAGERGEQEGLAVVREPVEVARVGALPVDLLVLEQHGVRVALEVPPQPAVVETAEQLGLHVGAGVVDRRLQIGAAPAGRRLALEVVVHVEHLGLAQREAGRVGDHGAHRLAQAQELELLGAEAVAVAAEAIAEQARARERVVGVEQDAAAPGLGRVHLLVGRELAHHRVRLGEAVDREPPDVEIGHQRRAGSGRAVHRPHVPGVAGRRFLEEAVDVEEAHRAEHLLDRDPVGPRLAAGVQRVLAAVAHEQHEARLPVVVAVADEAPDRVGRLAAAVELVVDRLERRHDHVEPLGAAQRRERVGGGQERRGGHEQVVAAALGVELVRGHRAVLVLEQELGSVEDDVGAARPRAVVLEVHRARPGGHVGELDDVDRVGHVVDPDRIREEAAGLDLVVAAQVGVVARQVAGEPAIAPPVGDVEAAEPRGQHAVRDRVGSLVEVLAPQDQAVVAPLAEGGRRQRGREVLEHAARPVDGRVRDGGELAGGILDLDPAEVRGGLAALELDREVHGVAGVEVVDVETDRVRPGVVVGEPGPQEQVHVGVGRDGEVEEVALDVLRPRVRGRHRRSAAGQAGAQRDARRRARAQARDVDHLAVAPGALGRRGARALGPVLHPHQDAVAGVEGALDVGGGAALLDLDRQLERGVGRRAVAGELVAVDAELRDRHAGRESRRRELGVLEREHAGRVDAHAHLGRSPDPGPRPEQGARAGRGARARRGDAPPPPLLVIEHRALEHRLPVAIRGERRARRRGCRGELEAHRDRAPGPQLAGRLVVAEGPDLDRDHALAPHRERLAQLDRRGGPGPVEDGRGRLARRDRAEPVVVVAERGPLAQGQTGPAARLLGRAADDAREDARPGRDGDERVAVGEARPPGLIEQRQPGALERETSVRDRRQVEGADVEAKGDAAVVGADQTDGLGPDGRGEDEGEERGENRAQARGEAHSALNLASASRRCQTAAARRPG